MGLSLGMINNINFYAVYALTFAASGIFASIQNNAKKAKSLQRQEHETAFIRAII
jgi:hypothetical protein